MPSRIILLSRKGILISDAQAQFTDPNITVYSGTYLNAMKRVFAET
jgi:hypothetical protein